MKLTYSKASEYWILFCLFYIIILKYFFISNLYIAELILSVIMIALVLFFQKKLKFNRINVCWLLATIVACFSVIYSIERNSSIQYCTLLIFFNILCLISMQGEVNKLKIIKYLMCFCGFHSIITIVQMIAPDIFYSFVEMFLTQEALAANKQFWKNGSYCGVNDNPGANGFYIAVFVVCIFNLVLNEKNKKKKVAYTVLLIGSCLALIMTQKRSFMIFVGVIVIISWIIGLLKSKRKDWYIAVSVTILCFLTYIVFKYGIDKLVTQKMLRYIQAGDITNGRVVLWKQSIRYFKENPIGGIGIRTIVTVIENDAHNIYLQLLAEVGIIGAILFYIALFYPFLLCARLVIKNRTISKEYFVSFSVQALFLLYGITGNPLFDHSFMWIYAVIIGISGGVICNERM